MLRAIARPVYHGLQYVRNATRFSSVRFDPSVQWLVQGAAQIGTGVSVGSRSVLLVPHEGTLRIGDGVWLGNDCELSVLSMVSIGARTSLQHRTQVHGDVTIGEGCVCAANLYISSSWHEFRREPHLPIRVQEQRRAADPQANRSRSVTIGDDCWLGINVVICPGVTVGRGCVVGANSVVTKDLAPYTIAAGSPAKPIGKRIAFAPPRRIDARESAHYPYFYAGVRQLGASASDDGDVRHARGGFAVANEWTLALPNAGSQVRLELDAAAPMTIRQGAQAQRVLAGAATVSFDVDRSTQNDEIRYLTFHWSHDGDRTTASDDLVIVSAEVR